MKKLILHIGTHKTGSTAIQNWLYWNRDTLAAQGVLYARTDREPYPHLKKHTSLHHALMHASGDFRSEWQQIEEEFEASGCHTMILSEEGLSGPRFLKLAALRDAVRGYDVTVICFFRRQDYMIESHWNQRCKEGGEKDLIETYARRPWTRTRMRYDRILDFWARFATVRAIAYHSAAATNSVAAFAAAAGLEYDGELLQYNRSPSMNCAAFCRLLNVCRLSRLSPRMIRRFRRDTRKYALGSALRAEVLADAAEGNLRLAEVYGIRFPPDLPEEGETPLRWPSARSLLLAIRP